MLKGLTYLDHSQILDAINHLLPVKAEPLTSILTSTTSSQSDSKVPGSEPVVGLKSESIPQATSEQPIESNTQ